jgi:hypothetical protein
MPPNLTGVRIAARNVCRSPPRPTLRLQFGRSLSPSRYTVGVPFPLSLSPYRDVPGACLPNSYAAQDKRTPPSAQPSWGSIYI